MQKEYMFLVYKVQGAEALIYVTSSAIITETGKFCPCLAG